MRPSAAGSVILDGKAILHGKVILVGKTELSYTYTQTVRAGRTTCKTLAEGGTLPPR